MRELKGIVRLPILVLEDITVSVPVDLAEVPEKGKL